MRLENKVAFISGGARGMGATEARMFSREGCKVVIGDLRDELGRQTEAEINELGGECLYVHLDVTDEQSWKDAIAATVERFGKLDILVNNAGVYMPERVEDTTMENWDVTMSVNAKGVFLGTKAAIPEMRRNGGGSIVNISSVAGLVGNHISSAYTASKGAVASVHQVHGHPARRRRHPLQQRASWHHRDRHDRRPAGRRRARGPAEPDSAGPLGPGGGHRLRRAVPGVGRGVIHDRKRTGD